MKTFLNKSLVVAALLGVAGVAGLMLARAQETATSNTTSIIPQSPANLRSIESYSNAQLEQLINALAAAPLIWPTNLPDNGMAGTFWSLAHPDWPPLPATFGTPVWNLTPYSGSTMSANSTTSSGSSFYLLDDIDYPPSPGDGGTNSGGGYIPNGFQMQLPTTNDLWLQITTTNTGTSMTAFLVINTPWNVTNGVYDLFATTNLAPSAWQWVMRCSPGQTNLTVTGLSSPTEFFIHGFTNDTTGCGITDAFKLLVAHANPNLYSTDGTGMSDGWEWQYFGRIGGIDPNADPTGDGLSNYQKFMAGLNPNIADNYNALLTEPKLNADLP